MGKYFTIRELCRSTKAKELGIQNIPSEQQEQLLTNLIENILDPLREAYGSPIYVNSGYRCPELNRVVKGSKNSHHQCLNSCAAADIDARSKDGNMKLFKLVESLNLPVCQCIDESNYSWIHVSYNPNDIRRQFLHL